MKTVRVVFEKRGGAKYISHLDVNRYMLRALQRSGLPVWRTQGFHPHIYCTFAHPLSLGYTSSYEVMEFRVMDDAIHNSEILARLQKACNQDLFPTAAGDAVMKINDLAFAGYELLLCKGANALNRVQAFFGQPSIPLERVSKKTGKVCCFDLKEKLREASATAQGEDVRIRVILPAGPKETVNPGLVAGALLRFLGREEFRVQVHRFGLYDRELNLFL